MRVPRDEYCVTILRKIRDASYSNTLNCVVVNCIKHPFAAASAARIVFHYGSSWKSKDENASGKHWKTPRRNPATDSFSVPALRSACSHRKWRVRRERKKWSKIPSAPGRDPRNNRSWNNHVLARGSENWDVGVGEKRNPNEDVSWDRANVDRGSRHARNNKQRCDKWSRVVGTRSSQTTAVQSTNTGNVIAVHRDRNGSPRGALDHVSIIGHRRRPRGNAQHLRTPEALLFSHRSGTTLRPVRFVSRRETPRNTWLRQPVRRVEPSAFRSCYEKHDDDGRSTT